MEKHDVFISYAHVDNEALLEDEEGWIAILQRALQKRLTQLMGRPTNVWWDRKRLTGNTFFDASIATACDNTTVMVSVVTPRYLKSDYCRKEVAHFSNRAVGLRVGDRSRLFACIKTPVGRGHLFPEMDGRLGYEFFRTDAVGRFREFSIYDPELKPVFISALEDLAQDVSLLLLKLEAESSQVDQVVSPPAAPQPNPAPDHAASKPPCASSAQVRVQRVFVASTSGDVKAIREGVVRELSSRDHAVQPAAAWSEDASSFSRELSDAVAGVALAVHVFGASYGTIPEDAEVSYPVLQYEYVRELAAQRPPDEPLARILWCPRGVQPSSPKQQALLDRVRNDAHLGPLDEVLEGTDEELKERVVSKLLALAQAALEREQRLSQSRTSTRPLRTSAPPSGVKKVYVISADAEESEAVMQVEQTLAAQGFDVISSVELAEEETEPEREALHQRWLEECDGCLIYHGDTKVSWVRAQIDEVRKALGHRPNGPMRGQAIYVAAPIDGLKRRYQVQFPKLEAVCEPAQALLPFVQQVIMEDGDFSVRGVA